MSEETWTVSQENNGVYLQSDNYFWDARLYLTGDFPSREHAVEYARRIAAVLNMIGKCEVINES